MGGVIEKKVKILSRKLGFATINAMYDAFDEDGRYYKDIYAWAVQAEITYNLAKEQFYEGLVLVGDVMQIEEQERAWLRGIHLLSDGTRVHGWILALNDVSVQLTLED